MRFLESISAKNFLCRGSRIVFVLLLALFMVFLLPTSLPIAFSKSPPPISQQKQRHNQDAGDPPLNVVTLAFGKAATGEDADFIEHNCLQIAKTRHKFEVHTDNMSASLCAHCNCIPFKKKYCSRPNKDAGRSHCEKLHFFIAQIHRLGEFLYLDSDLVILKETFLPHLYPRTRIHDALATYGHNFPNATFYHNQLNSGLIFIRRIPGLNYSEMVRDMYDIKENGDQIITSRFLFKYYNNWDSLSIKWHCRFLRRAGYTIPIDECYTLHDRREVDQVLNELNYTLLRGS